MSNKKQGEEFTKLVKEYLENIDNISLNNEYQIEVGLNSIYKKSHKYDLGNENIIVECKCYNWEKSGENPSGKIATLNEAMLYFHATTKSYKKKLFLKKTEKNNKKISETFAEYYVRLYNHLIPDDVEVWEFDTINLTAKKINI